MPMIFDLLDKKIMETDFISTYDELKKEIYNKMKNEKLGTA